MGIEVIGEVQLKAHLIEAWTGTPAREQKLIFLRGREKRELIDPNQNIYALTQEQPDLRFSIRVLGAATNAAPSYGEPSYALKMEGNTYPLGDQMTLSGILKKIEEVTKKPLGQSTEVTIVITRPVVK